MSRFEELAAFQRAMDLVEHIYETTEPFPRSEQYGLTSQIRRAAISVISNIAEGEGRLTSGEWRQMLSHARGSLFEVEAQLLAARRLQFIDDDTFTRLNVQVKKTGAALFGLIRFVRARENRPIANPRTPETPNPRNPETP